MLFVPALIGLMAHPNRLPYRMTGLPHSVDRGPTRAGVIPFDTLQTMAIVQEAANL